MDKQELIEKLKGHGAWCTECHDINGEKDRYVKVAKVRELLEQLDEPQADKVESHLAEHWNEDIGNVLWWDFPVEEPPYCGTPLDDDFPSYKTHFTQITMPDEVEEEPKYEVDFGHDTILYQADGEFWIEARENNEGVFKQEFTEKEIKAIDERYWAFASPVKESGKSE